MNRVDLYLALLQAHPTAQLVRMRAVIFADHSINVTHETARPHCLSTNGDPKCFLNAPALHTMAWLGVNVAFDSLRAEPVKVSCKASLQPVLLER